MFSFHSSQTSASKANAQQNITYKGKRPGLYF